jgi:hypothetical protein
VHVLLLVDGHIVTVQSLKWYQKAHRFGCEQNTIPTVPEGCDGFSFLIKWLQIANIFLRRCLADIRNWSVASTVDRMLINSK